MSHDDHSSSALMRQIAHHLHYVAAGVRVERCGGFVGQDDSRIASQSPGNRDSLLLAAAQVRGEQLLFPSPTCSSSS